MDPVPPIPRAVSNWMPAKIERIHRHTPRIASFFFAAPIPATTAGQFIDLRLTAEDGYFAQRSYSIAAAPGAELLEVAIERLDDGEVSTFFHDHLAAGDTIGVRGPIGWHFVWRAADGGPLLLIGGGSGVVPLVSMLRERMRAVAPRTPALLIYSARTWEELAFRDELLAMQADDLDFRLVIVTTRQPRRREGDRDRRLDAPMLADILRRWGHDPLHAFVCGSNAFVDTALGGMQAAGVPVERIRSERYGG